MSLYDDAVELGLKAAKAVSKGEIPARGLDLPNIDALGLTAPMKKGLDEVPKSVAPSTPSFEGLQGMPTPAATAVPKKAAPRSGPYELTEPEFADEVELEDIPPDVFTRQPVEAASGTIDENLKTAITKSIEQSRPGIGVDFEGGLLAKDGLNLRTTTMRSDAQLENDAATITQNSPGFDIDEIRRRLIDFRNSDKDEPSATIVWDDGVIKMDIGVGKNIKGTGEGADVYNGLYSFAKDSGVVVGASRALSASNTIIKNLNMASGILKLRDSSFVEANVEQFLPLSYTGKGTYGDINAVVGDEAQGLYKGEAKPTINKDQYKVYGYDDEDIDEAQRVIDMYEKYWNPAADGKKPEVTKARANNMLAAYLRGVDGGFAKGANQKQKEFALEVKQRLTERGLDFEKAAVEVTEGKVRTPILAVLKSMAADEKWKKILPAMVGVAILEDFVETEENDPGT